MARSREQCGSVSGSPGCGVGSPWHSESRCVPWAGGLRSELAQSAPTLSAGLAVLTDGQWGT